MVCLSVIETNKNKQELSCTHLKLIPNTFYGSDAVDVEFLPDLADVHINGAVAHDHFGAPDLVVLGIGQGLAGGIGVEFFGREGGAEAGLRRTPVEYGIAVGGGPVFRKLDGWRTVKYLRLTVEIDGRRRTRCYSPANSVHASNGLIELTAKAQNPEHTPQAATVQAQPQVEKDS